MPLVLPRLRCALLATATRVTLSPKFATLAMISRGERIEPRSQGAPAHIPTQGLFRRRGLSSPALALPPPPRSPARTPLQQCVSSLARPWDSSSEVRAPACLLARVNTRSGGRNMARAERYVAAVSLPPLPPPPPPPPPPSPTTSARRPDSGQSSIHRTAG